MNKLSEQQLQTLQADALFMEKKLAETRCILERQEIIIPYDNGGGQMGIRANPAFAEYEKLAKAYRDTVLMLSRLNDNTEDNEVDEIANIINRFSNSNETGYA